MPQARMTQDELLDAVKAHALKNYNKDGWDFLIECHDDAEVREAIGNASTLRGAIAKVRAEFALSLHDEMRSAARAEAF